CFYTVQGTEFDPVNFSDNCGVLSVLNDFNDSSTLEGAEITHNTTITWTVTDTTGNIQTCSFTVTVEDNQAPDIPEIQDISGECPIVVIPPTTIDNCGEEITGTTGISDLTFYESETIFWIFTDSSGNTSDPVEQKITVVDTSPPVPDVASLPKKTIHGCQITDISELDIPTATDACEGEIQGTLGPNFEFPFEFIGTEFIEWEYIDSNGHKTVQSQEIEVVPVNINGGTITGTFESTEYENQINLAACGERIIVELNLNGEVGEIIRWEKFAENDGEWRTISNITNNETVIFEVGELESTLYRVLTQQGSCTKYSNTFKIRALPAGDAPTVENLDNKTYYCYGENVNLLATSNYVVTQETIADQKGEFETGQLNTQDEDGWLVDGKVREFSCGGNNAKTRNWSCTGTHPNGHDYGDITYYTGSKIAVAQGNYFETEIKKVKGVDTEVPVYKDSIPSTLETPILDLSDSRTAYLNFDQAFNFVNDDIAVIEISIDGGDTYSILRTIHAQGSGPLNWYNAGTAESYTGSTSTYFNFDTDNTSISLQDYIGYSQVRVRWSFTGTSDESIWALDNIFVNKEVLVNTDLEWTVGIGDPDEDPIEVGRTSIELNFVPESPGYHQYGGTSLINDCRTYSEEGTGLIDIFVTYAYAGEDIILTEEGCGLNTVQLNAYDNTLSANQNYNKDAYPDKPENCLTCDNPGSGEIGVWSWERTSGTCEEVEEKFSDVNDPDATFTGNAGTYILTWTVGGHRADACSSSITVEIIDCDQVDFDGTNDYIDFGADNFNLSGTNNKKAFSIEVWVKPETINGTQTIFSKRDLNSTPTSGYDLRVDNGVVSFNWGNNASIKSTPYKISADRWHHLAVTHTFEGEYKLYIDGVFITRTGGGAPKSNSAKALLGAMDNSETRIPENYFNGWMEEFRVWDVALNQADIRLMMNQRIRKDNGKIIGEVLPLNISTLDWSSLIGYYRFENISCGNVLPYNDGTTNKGPNGWLKNITSPQQKSAPLPYISEADGNWRVRSTWDANIGTAGANWWDVPNGEGVNGEYINWNIVETKHDIIHNIDPSYPSNVNLLALISSSKTLKMDGDYNNETGLGLTVSKYLELNGVIDLNGNSQLVQPEGSILVESSSGYIDIDQQGTANSFNYNYWTSPVSLTGKANNYGFIIEDVLWSGTNNITGPINFNFQYHWADGNYTGDKRISTYWLYIFNEAESSTDLSSVEDEYFKWIQISESTLLSPGFGFSMKGTSGAVPISTIQNYTFRGKPNNGNIYVSAGVDQNLLTGNPYPSALNAEEFINDNAINEKNFNGALYFWDHFGRVNSHYLEHYIGGYAVYTKAGAVSPATSSDYRINNETTEKGTKKPGKYIPVGQGFFVSTNGASISSPTQLKFKNSQRAFVPESSNDSQFHQQEPGKGHREKSEYTQDNRFKIRLKLESPKGYHRQILVTADGNTTSGFDIGYDAPLIENNVEDMYWIIEEKAFVIQGVPDFNLDRVLPIGIKIAEAGTYTIKVDELENLDKNFTVFLKDKETEKYHDLTRSDFTVTTDETGRFNEKYEVVFTHPDMIKPKPELESDGSPIGAGYYKDSDELFIQNPELMKIDRVELYSVSGQKVMTFNDVATDVRTTLKIRQKLSSAVYIVKVYSDKRTYSRKVIITK
ncbi:LamG-like jellyroll fold domain-containing protein, partial [Christiangramia aquimixticola]|uniref:LamG-like jellyroll fold domain-containing protein n=1 Tax=Christiangramia aquimixticola TaxID=1697558 RepID=UPI003AA9D8FD